MSTDTTITVYSKPACQACKATERYLTKEELPYVKIDVTEDQEAYDFVASLGYKEMPVVVAGELHWSGLHIDKIKALSGK